MHGYSSRYVVQIVHIICHAEGALSVPATLSLFKDFNRLRISGKKLPEHLRFVRKNFVFGAARRFVWEKQRRKTAGGIMASARMRCWSAELYALAVWRFACAARTARKISA